MRFRVRLMWKVLVPMSSGGMDALRKSGSLFNLQGGRTFVRTLGGDFRLDQSPVVLSPTDAFHDALRETRVKLQLGGNRFPYALQWQKLGQKTRVNFALHLHESLLSATVRLDRFDTSTALDWAGLQELKRDEILWPLVRQILAIAVSGDRNPQGLANDPQVFPAIHIEALDRDEVSWREKLVCLVTRHIGVKQAIVEQVLAKNEPHRVDDESQLLIDKQGIAAYAPTTVARANVTASVARFEHAAAMLQLAAVVRLQLRAGQQIPHDVQLAILNPESAVPSSVSGRIMWSLIVIEFSLKGWLQHSLNRESKAGAQTVLDSPSPTTNSENRAPGKPLRILLVTVTNVETMALHAAMLQACPNPPRLKKIDGFSYQDFGVLGDFELIHQISGMGSGGIDGSQESVRRSIEAVNPCAVLMMGIAFGVDTKKQPVGTILVSKQISMYELQRIGKDAEIKLRGDRATASPMMLNWVSHAQINWDSGAPKIQVGLVLSGEKLIDNEDFRNQLIALIGEPIGGEMEGAGLYAACQLAKVDWLLVKAVCDWADGNKGKGKEMNQVEAAQAAAKFVVHLLRINSETRT